MQRALTEQKRVSDYVFDRPPVPSPVQVINTRQGIMAVSGTGQALNGPPTGAEAVVLNDGSEFNDSSSATGSASMRSSFGLWRRSSARSSASPGKDNTWVSFLFMSVDRRLISFQAIKVMFPNKDALPKYRAWFREAVDRNIKAWSWESVIIFSV